MSFFKNHTYNIYVTFNVLIRNNEQFDQNLHDITFFYFFIINIIIIITIFFLFFFFFEEIE